MLLLPAPRALDPSVLDDPGMVRCLSLEDQARSIINSLGRLDDATLALLYECVEVEVCNRMAQDAGYPNA